MTDRLTLTRALEGGGMQSEAAERIATEIYDAIHNNVATKTDIAAVRADMREMEQRIVIRLGGMLIAVATLLLVGLGITTTVILNRLPSSSSISAPPPRASLALAGDPGDTRRR